MGKRRCALGSAALLVACSSSACTERVSVAETQTLDPRGASTLEIHTGCGEIQVTPSDDAIVHVQTIRTALSEQNARALVVVRQVDADVVHLAWNGTPGDDGVSFVVAVPPTMRLTLWSGHRSIDVSGIQAAVDAHAESGAIHVDHSTGALSAWTGGGDVSVSTHHGSVAAHTGGGNIALDGALAGASKLDTGGGSIDVSLPADSDLIVDAQSASGPVSNDFGLPAQTQDGAQVAFHGTIGDGSRGTLQMVTAGGPIVLTKALGGP